MKGIRYNGKMDIGASYGGASIYDDAKKLHWFCTSYTVGC